MNFPPEFYTLSAHERKYIIDAQVKISDNETKVRISQANNETKVRISDNEAQVKISDNELIRTYQGNPDKLREILSLNSLGLLKGIIC